MAALHSAITAVTHNIPSFLRDPAVALIGEKCYAILVYDFDITHAECLKYAISKGLGLGIVVGGSIVKIPQIMKIISSQSARGLSLPAYILETASYAISLAYASRAGFPFSTYGENFFITIQNVVITLLILYLSAPRRSVAADRPLTSAPTSSAAVARVATGAVLTGALGAFLWAPSVCSSSTLSLLQAATIPLSLLSKAPQILENHSNQSTGNLSAFAVFSALLGCLARLFTTRQEVNDPLIFWGFAGAAVLNCVLAIQMVMYWQKSHPATSSMGHGHDHSAVPMVARRSIAEETVVESPIKVGVEEGGDVGRRWARKLD